MLVLSETLFATVDDLAQGMLILRPGTDNKPRYLLVLEGSNSLTTYDFEKNDISVFNRMSPYPHLRLPPLEVRWDAASLLPVNDYFPKAALVLAPGRSGIYLPGRYGRGKGQLVDFRQAALVEYDQSVHEIAFSRYEIGFMRGDEFVPLVTCAAEVPEG